MLRAGDAPGGRAVRRRFRTTVRRRSDLREARPQQAALATAIAIAGSEGDNWVGVASAAAAAAVRETYKVRTEDLGVKPGVLPVQEPATASV